MFDKLVFLNPDKLSPLLAITQNNKGIGNINTKEVVEVLENLRNCKIFVKINFIISRPTNTNATNKAIIKSL